MIIIYIFRLIKIKDEYLEFKTEKDSFNQINPSGTLKEYIEEDNIKGGNYKTYVFIKKKKDKLIEILGLLRYKNIDLEQFRQELQEERIDGKVIEKILNEIKETKSKIVYLRRIGIQQNYQKLGIGSTISSFFEFKIKKKKINCFLYSKVLEQAKRLFRTADTLKLSFSKEWNDVYYLILKSYYFNKD